MKSRLLFIMLLLASVCCETMISVAQNQEKNVSTSDMNKIQAEIENKIVEWEGEKGIQLRAIFGIIKSTPVVKKLEYKKGQSWIILAENLIPEFTITSAERRWDDRLNDGSKEEYIWWNYNDDPIRRSPFTKVAATVFSANEIQINKNGTRVEIVFPGVKAGQFSGSIRYTVFGGSNLFRVELLAKTNEDRVAYMYRGGLTGFNAKEIFWLDPLTKAQHIVPDEYTDVQPIKIKARNRIITAKLENGSVSCFPPPHAFFWARQLENNVGFNYYRKVNNTNTIAIGVRHNEQHEYYAGPNQNPWELYNARPGTLQRMAVYFYLSPNSSDACRKEAMTYTNNDSYKPLPGYKTMVNHFHMAFWEEGKKKSNKNYVWMKLFKELGVDIAYLNDFHGGDGHPQDTTTVRLNELKTYFEECKKFSNDKFLILPGEEPNSAIGGHWDILLPKPVYYTNRPANGKQVEIIEPYGKVYHLGNSDDVLFLLQQENGIGWTTHPRTKRSQDRPDLYKETALFNSPQWIGFSFKYLPADLSFTRLIDDRVELAFNDFNNWAAPKYMIGEIDTYKKFADYDLYGDFNVNYLKLDKLPKFGDWTSIVKSISTGNFFVSTGEVLIKNYEVKDGTLTAEVEWTFPLDFVEAVWSDGKNIDRKIISATDLKPFGSKTFKIPYPKEAKWVRFTAWDCAVNGAFTQPVVLNK